MIRPNRSVILREAALRSLNSGELVPGVPLRSSQTNGLQGYHSFLDNTHDEFERRHAYGDMATASGKTGLFSLITRHAYRIAQEKGIGDTFRTLIVEPSIFMLTQTRDALLRIAPELKDAVGIYGGEQRDLDKPIVIITFDSWLALLENGQLNAADIDLNINDEAHQGLSARRQNLINQVLTQTHHLGFTASSQYDREKTMELTHRNRFYHLPLREAIESDTGLTASVQVQYGLVRLLPQAMKRKANLGFDNIDFNALKRTEWARLVTHAYREETDGVTGQALSDKIALFFGANTAHADFVADMLNNDPVLQRKAKAKGFKNVATSVHTVGMSSAVQDELTKAFQRGEYMAAVGDKKFQAGFDYPAVKFIASYPGSSIVDTIQELGRATRQYFDPATGEEQGAVILETVPYIGDTDPEMDRKAQQKALRDLVTARDILQDTVVFRKGYVPPPQTERPERSRTKVTLSPGATAELFTTQKGTLTVVRLLDQAAETRILSEDLLLNYIQATYEKTGNWINAETKQIWEKQFDGSLTLVINETGRTIDNALSKRRRGLINSDGSPVANSLFDLMVKHGLKKARLDLNLDSLKEWVLATYEKTGLWITSETKEIWQKLPDGSFALIDETGGSIDQAFSKKLRGLITSDGSALASSLSDFMVKYGFKEPKPDLNPDTIREWILSTREKTGTWISKNSIEVWQRLPGGDFAIVNETGASINNAFSNKHRGLVSSDGSAIAASLSDFIINCGFKLAKPAKPDFDHETIRDWILATHEKTGKWATQKTKEIWQKLPDGSFTLVGETGGSIDTSLRNKTRGLINQDGSAIAASLFDFMIKCGFKETKPDLDQEIVEGWILATYEKTGKWLNTATKEIWQKLPDNSFALVIGETGASINQAFSNKRRGLINLDGSAIAVSLPDFRQKRGLTGNYKLTAAQEPEEIGRAAKVDPISSLTENWEPVTRQTLNDLFAQLSGTLVDRVAAAVVAQIQGQPEFGGTAKKTIEHQREASQEKAKPDSEGLQPIEAKKPDKNLEILPFEATPDDAASSKSLAVIPENQVAKFAAFDAPLFTAPDAQGDSMSSLLINAERSFSYKDALAQKSNLRKFVEMFIHRTLLAIDDNYLNSLNLLGIHRSKIEKIVRDYRYSCAMAEIGNPRSKPSNAPEPRIELAELSAAFREFTSILSVAKPNLFPPELNRWVRNIVFAGRDIHIQIKDRGSANTAQLLQDAFNLSKWFDAQFCKPMTEVTSVPAHPITLEQPPTSPGVAEVKIEKPVQEVFQLTSKETAGSAMPEMAAADTIEQPLKIPAAVLKTLGVTEQTLTEDIQGSRAPDYHAIGELVTEWTTEDQNTKRGRNVLAVKLYSEAAPLINDMIAQEVKIEEILTALNTNGLGTALNGGKPVNWCASLLLRGAVLSSASLPLKVFESTRQTHLDQKAITTPILGFALK